MSHHHSLPLPSQNNTKMPHSWHSNFANCFFRSIFSPYTYLSLRTIATILSFFKKKNNSATGVSFHEYQNLFGHIAYFSTFFLPIMSLNQNTKVEEIKKGFGIKRKCIKYDLFSVFNLVGRIRRISGQLTERSWTSSGMIPEIIHSLERDSPCYRKFLGSQRNHFPGGYFTIIFMRFF